ncbi:TIGR01777 family oxidoreductase [Paenibacillus sp. MMS18-CY102]|uniref:TIGR01777 family oxidoreductase n=1 Tax=Paenibacillus sp. MMS18-CY102 TaxID=2682849 RepID=UPI001365AFA1|nr:TIGR01777 family oxidoreductase [Paenibacillus sp. MMS18-CY102]MWC30099.1 TIGR01777 family protein [Paenibacillus sp. MMS18-CY102]
MRIAITGGTGFIGQALVEALTARGDEAIVLTRSIPVPSKQLGQAKYLTWDEATNPANLGTLDAIVNLAGETISRRWTTEGKKQILNSRLQAASRVADITAAQPVRPRVVVNASGISVYGSTEDRIVDESSPPGHDFLSDVVVQWEAAADRIPADRIVKLRTGVVLDAEGKAFSLMAMPYKLFVGGKVGSGKQWLSWIHREDMIRLILFSLDNEQLSGPINACAPQPVTNDTFGRALGKAFRRPHWFPVPAFAFRILFGEMSSLLLEGQRALPKQAVQAGFAFRHPDINEALSAIAQKR